MRAEISGVPSDVGSHRQRYRRQATTATIPPVRPNDSDGGNSCSGSTGQLWHESNRVCLTVLKYTIDKTIRQSIPEKDTAVDYLKAISEKFKKFDKSQKAYYLSLLDNTLYDGASGVREHMMKLVNYFNKLKSLKSLLVEFWVLRTTYNSQEAEWSIDQMMSIFTQEEESLKKAKTCTHSVNNITEGSSRKGGHEKYKEKKHQNKRSFGPKKDKKKDQGKMKKSFKGNCFYCKKSGHSISECFKLKNKREKEGVQGSSAEVECVGTIVLNLYSGDELILYDVVYVPSCRRSVVSTSVLDKQGYSFWQGSGRIDIYYNTIVVGTASLMNGLYCLNINSILESSVASVNTVTGHKRQRTDENSSMLWQRRLGHISRDRLERMVKQDILHDLDFSDFDSCVDCIKGKFPARARSIGAFRSESILDLIQTDISGPISPATLGNYKYFITIIDDYSRFGWIDLLHEKSYSLNAFKAFKATVELKSGKVIKSVRISVGVMPLKTAAYILNQVPSKSVEKTPYELFTRKKPSLKPFRVWGCRAEVRPYNPQLKKLDSRTVTAYFIGYCTGSRGCRLYCPNYSIRVIESDKAFYFENDSDNGENRDDILVENPVDPVVVSPIVEIGEPVVDLRRPQRSRKGAILDDYIVYLQVFESDVVEGTDPVSYREAVSGHPCLRCGVDDSYDERMSFKKGAG
ncbi:Retrovirus-related Pol polyprotein from transposon TNT 1-94 [Senna tora]|uniref:Retrovirus-related Pol polyprotein from transposon TNT 1-94 n=1 Tax=Senna tora TaxID=362788 RepID=A0A834VXR7_9FABA|nr:Retrovirus-related Pol polyprotein from transposon TNT 1-94 [Senna tora]